MQDHNTHRELIAAVASLKSCTRSVILAVSDLKSGSPKSAGGRISGSLQRANEAVGNLRRLLSAASDQTLTLPLSTSRRLIEVELPDLLEQLLTSCLPTAAWPLPSSSNCDSNGSNGAGGAAAAINHPSWNDVQHLIAGVFQVLSLLCGVAVRAYTRSSDPLVVLLQLSSPRVMQACVMYMEQLWDTHTHGVHTSATEGVLDAATVDSSRAATTASHSFACAVSAFSSCYSLLAAAVDVQPGLQELEMQLVRSLCSTRFLAVAVQLLLSSTCELGQQHAHEVQCQHAGWHLLTLALFLSGGDIAINPASTSSVEVRPGQHIPSSVLAAYMRQQDAATAAAGAAGTGAAAGPGSEGAAAASIAATEAATGLPLTSMQQQLLGPQVLQFLEERLYHAVREMRGHSSSGQGNSASAAPQQDSPAGGEQQILLPGRCVPDNQDVMAAALRTLRCWRALLVGPSGPTLPIASARGVQLLLAVLNGALAESVKDSSSERQALRGRLVRVAVHCLQLLCGCVEQHVLVGQLFGLTSALSKVVGAAGAYWDAHKRAIKSVDLPFTGQVRCVDKATGDMMVRYTMAAQSALSVLQQLAVSCKSQQIAGFAAHASGCEAVPVMLSAGLLPPMEQLFRQVPVVSPAHVAAVDLLVQVIPLCGSADLSAGQLALLTTLRKFLVKAVGIPDPDREVAIATATKLADMLGRLCSTCCSSGAPGNCCVLLQHAATHLLPALQMYCTSALKGPVPALCTSTQGSTLIALSDLPANSCCNSSSMSSLPSHLYPCVLSMYEQLARAARAKPGLGLLELLLGNQALAVSAALLGSNYWTSPQIATAAAQPGNSHLTGQHAAGLVTALLENLLGFTALTSTESPAAAAQLHISSSDDCLCSIKRGYVMLCAMGNPLCGVDGRPCECGSPKAYSDAAAHSDAASAVSAAVVAPVQGVTCSASPRSQSQAEQQQHTLQRQLLLSALLQSKLLPELQRLLQQFPAGDPVNVLEALPSVGGVSVPSRQGSLSSSVSAAITVPRTSSGNLQSRDSSRVGGHSPTFSMLNPSTSHLRTMGAQQPVSAFSSNSSSGPTARMTGLRFAAAAAAAKRSSGDGAGIAEFKALAGTSPPVEGDVGGLLRAASSSWSSLATGEVRLSSSSSRHNSSGFGSSPTLAALAVPSSESMGQDSFAVTSPAARGSVGGFAASAVPSQDGCAVSPALLPLQLRIEAILTSAGHAVLGLCDSGALADGAGRVSGASGTLSSSSSCDIGSKRGSWAGMGPGTATGPNSTVNTPRLDGRPSFSGSLNSFVSLPQEDVFAALRASLAAVRPVGTVGFNTPGSPAVAAVVGRSPRQQDILAGALLHGSSTEMLFPVDLGLAQLNLHEPGKQGITLNAVSSISGTASSVASPVASDLSPRPVGPLEATALADSIRGLVAGLQATGPVLARSCGTALDAEFSGHTLMARVNPKVVGCWNPGCVNMAGVSEAAAAAKPCGNCKVAVFCSKACEKTAWSSHTMACARLAALAQ